MSQKKSQHLGKLDEDEVMRVNPRTGTIQKSNVKIPEDLHTAAMRAGAKEIPSTTAVYKHAGKMYMFDYQDAANTQTAINFQSQFDDD
jgi:streptogramin lyase